MCCKPDHGRGSKAVGLVRSYDPTSLGNGFALMAALGNFHTCMYIGSLES